MLSLPSEHTVSAIGEILYFNGVCFTDYFTAPYKSRWFFD